MLDARYSLNEVKRLLIEEENELKDDLEGFKIALQTYEGIYNILAKLHFFAKEANDLQNAMENAPDSDTLLLLPELEVIERGLLESEMYLKTTTSELRLILDLHPDVMEYGLNDKLEGDLEDFSFDLLEFADFHVDFCDFHEFLFLSDLGRRFDDGFG